MKRYKTSEPQYIYVDLDKVDERDLALKIAQVMVCDTHNAETWVKAVLAALKEVGE